MAPWDAAELVKNLARTSLGLGPVNNVLQSPGFRVLDAWKIKANFGQILGKQADTGGEIGS